jgi:hypothetical protein
MLDSKNSSLAWCSCCQCFGTVVCVLFNWTRHGLLQAPCMCPCRVCHTSPTALLVPALADVCCCADDKPRQLMSQLVALLILHAGSCTSAELASAAQQLRTLTRERMDGRELQQLLVDLQAAHARVVAAHAAADQGQVAPHTADAPATCVQEAATSFEAAAAGKQTPGPVRRTKSRAAPLQASAPGGASSSNTAALHAATAVPASIARHTQRRSRLKVLEGSAGGSRISKQLQLAGEATATPAKSASSTALGIRKCPLPTADDASDRQTAGIDAVRSRRSSRPQALAAVAEADKPGPWRPSVVLVLDNEMQQLPWGSCAGLQHQNLCRYVSGGKQCTLRCRQQAY